MKSKIITSVRLLGSGHEHKENKLTNVSKNLNSLLATVL